MGGGGGGGGGGGAPTEDVVGALIRAGRGWDGAWPLSAGTGGGPVGGGGGGGG